MQTIAISKDEILDLLSKSEKAVKIVDISLGSPIIYIGKEGVYETPSRDKLRVLNSFVEEGYINNLETDRIYENYYRLYSPKEKRAIEERGRVFFNSIYAEAEKEVEKSSFFYRDLKNMKEIVFPLLASNGFMLAAFWDVEDKVLSIDYSIFERREYRFRFPDKAKSVIDRMFTEFDCRVGKKDAFVQLYHNPLTTLQIERGDVVE